MDSSETYLTLTALAFELGIPVAAIAASIRSQSLRRFAAVVLGAVAPFVMFYVVAAILYSFNPASETNVFSFHAMWAMSFPAYVAVLLVGTGLAFVPRPFNLYARFFMGFASAPLSFALLNLAS